MEFSVVMAFMCSFLQFKIMLAAVARLGVRLILVLVIFLDKFLSLYAADVRTLFKQGALSFQFFKLVLISSVGERDLPQ